MAQKMSLIKEQLGTASNSLRAYSTLAGLSIPDSMSELNSYSQRYVTLQICGGADSYVSNIKIDYSPTLIGKISQVGIDNSPTFYTITGFTNTTSGRTIVSVTNYNTIFTSCQQALNTTVISIAYPPDEGTLCDASRNYSVIIDFGSNWSTTTTLKELNTGENVSAGGYMGATGTYPNEIKSTRYWNGSSFVGAQEFC
jgi:hypothetical protein